MPTFLISRPDAIGDVVLTLPLAGWLKQRWPGCRVVFLGRAYTAPVIRACAFVDEFVDGDALLALPPAVAVAQVRAWGVDTWLHVLPHRRLATLAWRAGVPVRVGTRRRWWHWLTCNRLVALSRRYSDLHEAELNLRLLTGCGAALAELPTRQQVPQLYGLTNLAPLPPALKQQLEPALPGQWRVILHPKSQGSAREWPCGHFAALARTLHAAGHRVFLTGTAAEGQALAELRQTAAAHLTDLSGRLTLSELLSFIAHCDALVAASTGPLHLAAALGRGAVGLYPPMPPMHPGRWAPLGPHAIALTTPQRVRCADCIGRPAACHCLPEITVAQVMEALQAVLPR